MNITLGFNVLAMVMVGVAIAIAYPPFPEHVASVALGFFAGVITAKTSEWQHVRTDKVTVRDFKKGLE